MEITLEYETLTETVKRSLSVIGKRSIDDKGNLLFTDITVGTNEEPLITDYLRQAVIDLSTELSPFAEVPEVSPEGITLYIDLPTNHAETVEPFLQQCCEAYCVSYALYSWFTVTAPRLVAKYQADCSRQSEALIRLLHEKSAPDTPELTYADIPGSVILNS